MRVCVRARARERFVAVDLVAFLRVFVFAFIPLGSRSRAVRFVYTKQTISNLIARSHKPVAICQLHMKKPRAAREMVK